MKAKKILGFVLFVLHLVFFFCGIIMIMRSESKAINLVTDTIESEDILINMEQVEQSIELYTKEYKKRGTCILILSSMGIIESVSEICTRNKVLQFKNTKGHDEL